MVLSGLFFIFLNLNKFCTYFLWVYMHISAVTYSWVGVCRSEDHLSKFTLPFYHVGPKYWLRLSDFSAPRIYSQDNFKQCFILKGTF